jgi:hypothetical protein
MIAVRLQQESIPQIKWRNEPLIKNCIDFDTNHWLSYHRLECVSRGEAVKLQPMHGLPLTVASVVSCEKCCSIGNL